MNYKPGKHQASADLFSRLPLPEFPKETLTPPDTLLLMECLLASPTTFTHGPAVTPYFKNKKDALTGIATYY